MNLLVGSYRGGNPCHRIHPVWHIFRPDIALNGYTQQLYRSLSTLVKLNTQCAKELKLIKWLPNRKAPVIAVPEPTLRTSGDLPTLAAGEPPRAPRRTEHKR